MPLPSRRWFQFKLSTWFVLVAILAWAMLEGLWVVKHYVHFRALPSKMHVTTQQLNPSLIFPALALAAFVGWKAAWAIGRRVKTRKACG